MKSANLSQPIISCASAALAAETTTWAEEAECSSVCMCVDACGNGNMVVVVGLYEDRVAQEKKQTKKNIGNIFADTQILNHNHHPKRCQTASCMSSEQHVEMS